MFMCDDRLQTLDEKKVQFKNNVLKTQTSDFVQDSYKNILYHI